MGSSPRRRGALNAVKELQAQIWMFAGLLIVAALVFILGGFGVIRAWEAEKTAEFIERAERLG